MFKRVGQVLTLALFVGIFSISFNGKAKALDTQNFYISSFQADYYLSKNDVGTSLMTVKEQITAVFPDFDQNHGILRAIPKTYLGHTVSLDIASIKDQNGLSYKYTTYSENDNLVLKIGDASRYVHGETVYKITYSMRNVIDFESNDDQLNWDVNGDQWYQRFDSVIARIHVPAELATKLQSKYACYTGYRGSTAQNCTINSSDLGEETLITSSANNLEAGQTLTFGISFDKGTFTLGPEIAAAKRRAILIGLYILGSLTLPPILTTIYMINRWRKYGKDPKGKGVIIPQYTPPKGFNALTSAFIKDENLSTKAITASIIELAIKHILLISEIKIKHIISSSTDYSLKLLKNTNDLSQEQRSIIEALFGVSAKVGDSVNLKDLKYKLYTKVKGISDIISIKLSDDKYFAEEPSKVKTKYAKKSIIFFVIAGVLFPTGIILQVLVMPFAFGIAIAGVIVLLFSGAMPVKTASGVEIAEHLKGLKEYINLAEKDRLKFLQSVKGAERVPDMNNNSDKIKLFEALLPYAMLFGLEKSWATEFTDIYSEPPDWYSGNWSTFNAAYLASSISSMNTATSAAFSSPSSSGGGGGAGGGGGGGGGGGW